MGVGIAFGRVERTVILLLCAVALLIGAVLGWWSGGW